MIHCPDPQQIMHRASQSASAVAYPPDRILCRVLGMFKMFVHASDVALGPHLALDGYWESWVTSAFWRIVQPGMHVVNVGANVGYYAVLAAQLVGPKGRVDAFEPNPILAQILRDNAQLNGFWTTIRVHELAASNKAGEVTFRYPAEFPMNGSIVVSGKDWLERTVKAVTLDEALDHRPDVIFVDAEGAEPLVIEGALGKIKETPVGPTLVLEWAPARYANSRLAAAALSTLGYRVWIIAPDGSESPITADAFMALDQEVMITCRRHPGGA